MKYEWKKQEKEFYGAKKSPALVTVPAQNYIMIGGKGNPNDVDFSNRVSALYSLAYAIKMAYKTTAIQNEFNDFTVFPLEGIWQKIEETVLVKENLGYTIMIRQPDFICEDIVKAALEQVKVKKPNPLFDEISFGTMNDGKCVEILHIGAFDDEPISFDFLHPKDSSEKCYSKATTMDFAEMCIIEFEEELWHTKIFFHFLG